VPGRLLTTALISHFCRRTSAISQGAAVLGSPLGTDGGGGKRALRWLSGSKNDADDAQTRTNPANFGGSGLDLNFRAPYAPHLLVDVSCGFIL
jgi:hypothetical protein